MIRKVAIIGAGIGAKHLDAYLSLSEHFTVNVICDLNKDRAAALAAPHGMPVETDLARVLADTDIDLVDICLPPHLHLPACLSALHAGKTVLCEKPLVTSLADADRLAVTMQKTGMRVFPVFQYRFGLGMSQLRALVDAGLAGRCFAGSLETHWNRDSDYYAVDWRGTWAGEQGGALLGHAIHAHDLITAILGPVARVYAETATRVNDIETEDCAALTLRMSSGAVVTSSVTLGAAKDTSRLRLMFEGFTVESDHAPYTPAAKAWTFTARAPCKQDQIEAVLSSVSEPRSDFAGLLTALAAELNGQPSAAVTFEDGRRSLELVTAAYQSARSGTPVDLPLRPDHPLYAGWQPS